MSLQQTMKSTAFAMATLGAGVSAESHLQKAMFRGGAPDRDLSAILAGGDGQQDGNVTKGDVATADVGADGNMNLMSAEQMQRLTENVNHCADMENMMKDKLGADKGLTWGSDDNCNKDAEKCGEDDEQCIADYALALQEATHTRCCVSFLHEDVTAYVAQVAATNKEHGCKDDEMWVEDKSACESTDLVLKSMGIDSEDFFGANGDIQNDDGSMGDDVPESDKQSKEKESKNDKKMSVEWVLPAFAAGALALLAVFGLFVHRRRSSAAVVEDGSAAASPSKKAEKTDEKVAKNEDKKRLASVTSSGLNGGGASSKNSSGRKIYGGRSASGSPRSMGASDKKSQEDFETRMEVV